MSIINLKSAYTGAYTAYKTLADREEELMSEVATIRAKKAELVASEVATIRAEKAELVATMANAEAEVNKTVGAQVDTAGTVALDGVQTGLNKANTAITEGRKPAKK